MNELKKISLKRNMGIILFWAFAGIAFLCEPLPSVIKLMHKPIPLEEVDFDGNIEGLYVSGSIPIIYDWYCDTRRGERIDSREYIIDGGDNYMGMWVRACDMEAAERLYQASVEYLEGRDNGTALQEAQYEIIGTITKMPEDAIELYHEYIEWGDMGEEMKNTYLPYYLKVNIVGEFSFEGMRSYLGVGCLCFLLSLNFVISSMYGKCQKNVKFYISNSGSPDRARERAKSFMQSTTEYKRLRYDKDFICGEAWGRIAFGEAPKLIWAYYFPEEYKKCFITLQRMDTLILVFENGIRQVARVNSEADAMEHIERLRVLCPQAIYGYSKELERIFYADLTGFKKLRYYQFSNDIM